MPKLAFSKYRKFIMDPVTSIDTVLGICANVVGLVQAIKNIQALPEAFQQLRANMALVEDILKKNRDMIDIYTDRGVAMKAMESCQQKMNQLQGILQTVEQNSGDSKVDTPKPWSSVKKVYRNAVLRLGKGSKGRIEDLMKGILDSLRPFSVWCGLEDQLKHAWVNIDNMEASLEDEECEPTDNDLEIGGNTLGISPNHAQNFSNDSFDSHTSESFHFSGSRDHSNFGTSTFKAIQDIQSNKAHPLLELSGFDEESVPTNFDSLRGTSSPKLVHGIFAEFLSAWSIAGTAEAQMNLLQSLGKHRPTTSPKFVAAGVGSTWQGWLRCEWELPRVVQQMRESGPGEVQTLLGNFVIITGAGNYMECSTCAQFLEKTWKTSGTMALEALSRCVSLLEHGATTASLTTHDATIHVTDNHMIIRVGEHREDAQSFVDAIVWVCTAVRVNPHKLVPGSRERSQLLSSKATQLMFIKESQHQALVYGLEPLAEVSEQDLDPQARCWTGLFSSGILAFHHLKREWGAGLEIPFDMMIHLSGVENAYRVQGGIIFIGFFTALVPISYNQAENAIQWHFEEADGLSDGPLKPSSLPSVRGDWHRAQEVNMLRTPKCFLGWFARANILLGTHKLFENSDNMLRWSTETKDHSQSAHREGFEAAVQLAFTVGPINASLQFIRTWRLHSNVQHYDRHQNYSMALKQAHGNVAVIIDSKSEQVWLVPMLSVVLHLCHQYFQEFNHDDDRDNPIPFADPSPDGASEAARVLGSKGDVSVFGASGDPDAENLRQLFLRINTNLLDSAWTREPSNKKKLFASELMAMVTEPGRGSPLKEVKATADMESWVSLLEKVDFVGVCANIGHLIEPDPSSAIPCACSALPCNKYLLAAHMRCLDVLSRRKGRSIRDSLNRVCRLGDEVFWNMERLCWAACPATRHDPIWNEKEEILQQISRKEKGKSKDVSGLNGQAFLPQYLPEDGVVVFGGDPTKRTSFFW